MNKLSEMSFVYEIIGADLEEGDLIYRKGNNDIMLFIGLGKDDHRYDKRRKKHPSMKLYSFVGNRGYLLTTTITIYDSEPIVILKADGTQKVIDKRIGDY